MYKRRIVFPCANLKEKTVAYANVKEAMGIVQEHKISYVKGELTLYVFIEPENDKIFENRLRVSSPDATIFSSSRGR